jgi:hypothetical protein
MGYWHATGDVVTGSEADDAHVHAVPVSAPVQTPVRHTARVHAFPELSIASSLHSPLTHTSEVHPALAQSAVEVQVASSVPVFAHVVVVEPGQQLPAESH